MGIPGNARECQGIPGRREQSRVGGYPASEVRAWREYVAGLHGRLETTLRQRGRQDFAWRVTSLGIASQTG